MWCANEIKGWDPIWKDYGRKEPAIDESYNDMRYMFDGDFPVLCNKCKKLVVWREYMY